VDAKDALQFGLEAIRLATSIAPELGELLHGALAADETPLAAQVRAILPEVSASAKAAEEIRQMKAERGEG
jgi:hypothetical protein